MVDAQQLGGKANITNIILIGILLLFVPLLGPPAIIALFLVVLILFFLLWSSFPVILIIGTILSFTFVIIPLFTEFISLFKLGYKKHKQKQAKLAQVLKLKQTSPNRMGI